MRFFDHRRRGGPAGVIYVAFFAGAIGAVGGAVAVIAMRNPFYSVLALVVHLVSLAGLFLLLYAQFVAAAQVVVYAGAVMVLYVFVAAYVGAAEEPLWEPIPGQRFLAPLLAAALLFAVGAGGVLIRRSPLVILLCLELMLNAGNLALVAFSRAHGNAEGQVFALIVMVVAACEVVVGLGLIVAVFRRRLPLNVDDLRELRG